MIDPSIGIVYRISNATKKYPEIWNIGGTHCYKYTRVMPDYSHNVTYKSIHDGTIVYETHIQR